MSVKRRRSKDKGAESCQDLMWHDDKDLVVTISRSKAKEGHLFLSQVMT